MASVSMPKLISVSFRRGRFGPPELCSDLGVLALVAKPWLCGFGGCLLCVNSTLFLKGIPANTPM